MWPVLKPIFWAYLLVTCPSAHFSSGNFLKDQWAGGQVSNRYVQDTGLNGIKIGLGLVGECLSGLCNSLLFKKMVIDLVGRWAGLQQIYHQGVGFIVSLIGWGQWKSFRVVSQQYPPLRRNCKGPSGQMGRPPTDMLKIYASIQFR